jgi:hypothetical protein
MVRERLKLRSMGVSARTRQPPGSDLLGDTSLAVDVDKQPNSFLGIELGIESGSGPMPLT